MMDLKTPFFAETEYRLYYDDKGRVLFYTCEKPEGNYIVIDKDIYAEGRIDVRVMDGKVMRVHDLILITKLIPVENGVRCASEDISIIVDEDYNGSITNWSTRIYEFR